MKATVNGVVVAESDETIIVEGNHYFPPESVNRDYFSDSSHHTVCSWKGTASYYNVVVNGEELTNAAWYYPDTKDAASHIQDYVAFYPVVSVSE